MRGYPTPGELALAATLLLTVTARQTRGDIECYCNEEWCATTAYVCKSQTGCYSKLAFDARDTSSRHGCIDQLPRGERLSCQGEGDIVRTRPTHKDNLPVLICCSDNMCNYMGAASNNGNSMPSDKDGSKKNEDSLENSDSSGGSDTSQGDLWFKAAVIAVPISGGFILVLLVLLAVRMLKSDNKRHKRLVQMRHQRSFTKAQLYVADHFCDNKPMQNTHFQGVHIQPTEARTTPVYKNVNIKKNPDTSGRPTYEKFADSSDQDSSCNSVVMWGQYQPQPGGGTAV